MTDAGREQLEMQAAAHDPEAIEEFEALLAYLKQSRGVDFSGYKRPSLMRRVLVRMQTVGVAGFSNYQDFLQADTLEFGRLFNTILINVTAFFRDQAAWDYLGGTVIPQILTKTPRSPVRVWSAGCASGEEAYSLAMLLAEAMDRDEFRERVKIYATDIDEEALGQARQAVYETRTVQGLAPGLLEKYFERQGERYLFDKELRRSVIFGRHDLMQDAPISRVNLVICRNCLMYFNSEAQSRILSRIHFALTDGGVLFLGKAETMLTRAHDFTPLDMKRRLFTKSARAVRREGRALTGEAQPGRSDDASIIRLKEVAAENLPLAHMVVNQEGMVVETTQQLRAVFGLTQQDLGRPLKDLELSYRPFELRSALDQAQAEQRPITQRDVQWTSPTGQSYVLDLVVVPLRDLRTGYLGASVSIIDVTRQHRLQDEVQHANQELETALEELQSTNEELETTNEELQSAVEELETTNEELQSTNEELETINEELQSTNEELQTINDDAQQRSAELGELNAFLGSILANLRSAVIMLDIDLSIHSWNRQAEELWGLRPEEVLRKNFLNLDSGLPVDRLREPVRACLSQKAPYRDLRLEAVNRRGKPIQLKVTCTPLLVSGEEEPRGVVLLMEESEGPTQGSGEPDQ